MKNKTTAALLAFFLGGFGAHFFYLGKAGRGVLCILFFWTLIPAIIAFIDFIRFLTMSDYDFNVKYNNGLGNITPATVNISEELQKLNELKLNGILTEEEFAKRKEKMLQSY
ncbi:NINE protein [Pontibacter silvestris]|uniref:NINE protein n=1 Tax=Pontibacter silvestris TaxID=2305183 RepID=A0ABW4WU62_9BACT|nr:NINE protein [Pontibacter silvestris]MCC9138771.1 NINE protein [Pontibacter silvestris]